MEKYLFILAACASLCAHGAWYWPFGGEDGTNSPPRLHVLLRPANDYIELAQDASLDGDAEKALANYRLALGELDRIEAENPERAATSEFAPLRSRRAACTAAMDAIRFAQINGNVRPVAVTDTRELQKKWNERRSAPTNAVPTNAVPPKAKPPKAEPPKPAATNAVPPKAGWDGRIAQATARIRAKDYAGADAMLEAMQKERPKDLDAMLLRSAAQAGTGNFNAAQRTLERAMRAHPKSYLPYYNLASIAIRQNDLDSARGYYEIGRAVGGPESRDIESKIKGAGR